MAPLPDSLIGVALVEDSPHFRDAFSAAIRAAPDMQLLGVAETREQGLRLLDQPPADVLLVDLGLPDGSGIDVMRAALQRWPRCNMLVSTVFGDEAHVMQCLAAGATGYVLKDSSPEGITHELRTVHAGGSPISPLIARKLLGVFRPESIPAPTVADASGQALVSLSGRETQVLQYVTKGFTYEEIAGLMSISRNTVLSFVRRIYAKLEVRSQIEAIDEARRQGLLAS